MAFVVQDAKGLDKCYVDDRTNLGALTLHISEIAPGTRAHPPHVHEGLEAFHILEGHGRLETAEDSVDLYENQVVILDASIEHGLVNVGDSNLRYVVVIVKQ